MKLAFYPRPAKGDHVTIYFRYSFGTAETQAGRRAVVARINSGITTPAHALKKYAGGWKVDESFSHAASLEQRIQKERRRILYIIEDLQRTGRAPIPQAVARRYTQSQEAGILAAAQAFIRDAEGSKSTRKGIRNAITAFTDFLAAHQIRRFSELEPATGSAFVQFLQDRGQQPGGVNYYLSRVRAFLRESHARAMHDNTAYLHWRGLKRPPYRRPTPTAEEVAHLEGFEFSDPRHTRTRDQYLFLLYMAFRHTEAAGIGPESETQPGRIEYRKAKIKGGQVVTKTKKMGKKAREIWARYGGQLNYPQVTTFNFRLKSACKAAGLDRPVLTKSGERKPLHEVISSHSGRRYFATRMLREGIAESLISNALGHRDKKSIVSYLNYDDEDSDDLFDNI